MLISPEKMEDMRIRDNLLELVEIHLRLGKTEQAKKFGLAAQKFGEKIQANDYPKRDKWMRPVDNAPLPTTKDDER